MTVEVDPVRVESRLVAGELRCPSCRDGVLAGWGFARARRVEGLGDPVRPRRARCRSCLATQVLLPVTLLLRRAYGAEQVWMALTARARGAGHRRIAIDLGVPPATVRGWLRRAGRRLEPIRSWCVGVAVAAGIDVVIPDGLGCPWRDVVAAVGCVVEAIGGRFGSVGLLGGLTAAQVVVAVSGGRLLAPGWPPA